MSGELQHRIPVPDADWRERMEAKLDALVVALLGSLEKPGGALKRIDLLEADVATLKAANATENAQRLTWKNALSLTTAGALISQAVAWAIAHLK